MWRCDEQHVTVKWYCNGQQKCQESNGVVMDNKSVKTVKWRDGKQQGRYGVNQEHVASNFHSQLDLE